MFLEEANLCGLCALLEAVTPLNLSKRAAKQVVETTAAPFLRAFLHQRDWVPQPLCAVNKAFVLHVVGALSMSKLEVQSMSKLEVQSMSKLEVQSMSNLKDGNSSRLDELVATLEERLYV